MSVVVGSDVVVCRGAALGADARRSSPATGALTGRGDREPTRRAEQELAQLEADYDRALDRGLRESSREGIDAAFDEADRLHGQMLVAIRRARVLERQPSLLATANGEGPHGPLVSEDRELHLRPALP